MRWDPTDEVFAGLGADDYWRPRLFSPAMLGAVHDRALWPDVAGRIAGFDTLAVEQTKAWAYSVKLSLAGQATGQLGLPAGLADGIADALLGYFTVSKSSSIDGLMVQLGKTAIGITTQALSSVPILGPIAAAIGGLAQVMIDLKTKTPEQVQEFFPPLSAYKPTDEEFSMNTTVRPALTTANWTGLFLPALGDNLKISRRQDVLGAWILESTDAGGLGFVPGSQGLSRGTQAVFVKKDTLGRGGDSVQHQEIGNFYPSIAQLLTSVSAQVQSPNASLYSVRVPAIRSAWRRHMEAVEAFLTDLWNNVGTKGTGLSDLNESQRHAVVSALAAPYYVNDLDGRLLRGVLINWSPGGAHFTNIVDAFVEPWCTKVEARQDYYLDTTVAAYVAPGSPLTVKQSGRLRRNRNLLLESPARRKVNLDDVIDDGYRQALFASTVGQTLVAPTTSEPGDKPVGLDGEPPAQPPPGAQEPSGGAPFEQQPAPGGGGWWAVGALVLAATMATRRRARRRS